MCNLKYMMLLVTTTLICPPSTNSLPNGAPTTICDTMLPFHGGGIAPRSSVAQYRLETSSGVVGQGQTLRVEITGVPAELAFGGFMIMARNNLPPYEVVGQFTQQPNDDKIKYINCGAGPASAATHISPSPKVALGLDWQAPRDFLGEVVFNATVAQSYDQFWVGIPSSPVRIVRRDAAPPVIGISTTRNPITSAIPVYVEQTTPAPIKRDAFYDECGSTKTCFGIPQDCVDSQNCRSVAAVEVRGDRYFFEMKANFNNPAYVAVALSTDDKMGDDSVIECVPERGTVKAYSSWTNPRPNLGVSRDGIPQNNVNLVQGSYVDGTIFCRIERNPVSTVKGQSFDLINNRYFLLIASGSSVNPNGAGYHDLGRLQTAQAFSLAEVKSLAAASPLLLRLHGAFMIIAWIGTTSLGIVLARYFKQTWVGSEFCGKDQWFAWHRICMVITWTLTMAGFVIIFVEIGAWSSERNPHAILGVVTTILCFLQPIGALLRPAPNSKNRPFFNWGHWLGGNAAHILAIITIFFAVKLTKAELPEWLDWILVAFVAFHVIMHLIFSISGCTSDRRASQRVNTFPMTDISPSRGSMKLDRRKVDAPFAGLRKLLLGIYIIILIIFVVCLVVIVVLAPIEETVENIKSQIVSNP